MTTTIYQKFISRYAETFTLIEMTEGFDYAEAEVVPAAMVAQMNKEELENLIEELREGENEKASWSDGNEPVDEEDARAADHQNWDEIDSFLDKQGL